MEAETILSAKRQESWRLRTFESLAVYMLEENLIRTVVSSSSCRGILASLDAAGLAVSSVTSSRVRFDAHNDTFVRTVALAALRGFFFDEISSTAKLIRCAFCSSRFEAIGFVRDVAASVDPRSFLRSCHARSCDRFARNVLCDVATYVLRLNGLTEIVEGRRRDISETNAEDGVETCWVGACNGNFFPSDGTNEREDEEAKSGDSSAATNSACGICLEKMSREYAIVPCGHVYACASCHVRSKESSSNRNEDGRMSNDEMRCFICRRRIWFFVRLFRVETALDD